MLGRLLDEEGRWIHAILVLGTACLAFILLGLVSGYLQFFSDVLFQLFIAWLFAFILSPVVSAILRRIPALPRVAVVVFVYGLLFVVLSAAVLAFGAAAANNVSVFIAELPALLEDLPTTLAPWQEQLNRVGLSGISLVELANRAAATFNEFIRQEQVARGLADIAVASLGVVGNLLLVVFLSLFIVVDKERIVAFLNRLVPPRFADEAKLFETSVAASFGGFLRGQVLQGLVYGAFAAAGSIWLNLPYWPATTALVVIFQIIPFFGPFISWAPPVVVAILTSADASATPNATLWIAIVMGIGWFITMNVVQPRVMATAVGIHPVMVLVSVLLGLKIYGVVGAIFAIPVAAVISAFFFHYLSRSATGSRDVASRAARRVEERAGRRVRVPVPPDAPAGAADLSVARRTAPGREESRPG
ncbi:MAG: AI-2E family transporter [Chloroflexota bacterium]